MEGAGDVAQHLCDVILPHCACDAGVGRSRRARISGVEQRRQFTLTAVVDSAVPPLAKRTVARATKTPASP